MYLQKKISVDFNLSKKQYEKIQQFLHQVYQYNIHTNIVGKSTLNDPWNRHVLDSLQISYFIKNKKKSILDMGSGAGLPGIILSIYNYTNVSLVDSNIKKIRFMKNACSKLNIKANIYHQKIESFVNIKFDYLVSRALASLNKLFFYSYKLLKKDSTMVFLKGKNIANEINEAKKFWRFTYLLEQSLSDTRGNVIIVNGLDIIND